MFDLSGKIALVTGSSRGLGYTMATGLAKAGAYVILNGRKEEQLVKAVSRLKEEGYRVGYSVFNVYEEARVAKAVEQLHESAGPVDILINNAGMNLRNPLVETPLADWDEVLRVNLTGAFIVSREVVKSMIARKQGKIINICSMMSELGRETTGAYAAAKGGLKMLTRAMCAEWARHNIQVNGIGPGYFLTDMTRPLAENKAFNEWITARTPARRWGEPEELTGVALFLSSEASSFVNGQVIYVDGGLLAAL
jgi:gluconate 5-dehydrogenase